MRAILFLLFSLAAAGLDNAVRITDRTGSTQSNRPFIIGWVFAEDEICGYPQPFTGGSPVAVWQSDNINRWPASALCPDGSVQRADISFRATVPANGTLTVEFRNSTNPCSSGAQAACDAAALSQAAMLAFNGGTWTTEMRATANPQGSTTMRTFDPRAVMAAGRWRYRLRGPAVTQVIVGDVTRNRVDDFGFREPRVARFTDLFGATDTQIAVEDASHLASLSRPFVIEIDGEHMSICFVSGNTLYVGTTNGSSASCATSAGRGLNSTTATYHSAATHGNFLRLQEPSSLRLAADIYGTAGTTITLTDASSINAPTVLQTGSEQIRVCNRSGNVLTVGTGSWGCAANQAGRSWRGTNPGFGTGSYYWPANTVVYNLNAISGRWTDAPADRFKSLHPEAVVTFFDGWPGVGIIYHLNNYWTDRMQDQVFDLDIRSAGSSIYTLAEIKQIPRTRLRLPVWNTADRMYWNGTAPGEVRYDYNHRYKKHAGIIPHDPQLTLAQSAIDQELFNNTATSSVLEPSWENSDKCYPDTYTTLDGSWKTVKGLATGKLEKTTPALAVPGAEIRASATEQHAKRFFKSKFLLGNASVV